MQSVQKLLAAIIIIIVVVVVVVVVIVSLVGSASFQALHLGRALQPGGQAGRSAGQVCSERAVMFPVTNSRSVAPHVGLWPGRSRAQVAPGAYAPQQAQLFFTAHCKGALYRAPVCPSHAPQPRSPSFLDAAS